MKKGAWYKEGLRFECTQCGKCCSGAPGAVWVDPQEIVDLAQAMHMEEEPFRDKFLRQIGNQHSLNEHSDGDCIFLEPETRHCMVYAARPIQCRTWPFWDSNLESKRTWGQTCRICPGAGEGKLYSLAEIDTARNKKSV